MGEKQRTYERLEAELAEAESIIAALRTFQVDAIIGEEEVLLLQLHTVEETLHRTREGLEQRVEERTAELRLANEQLRDEIARRQKAEEELEIQRLRIMQIDRLRVLGQMAGGMAHELGQPLMGIRAYADRFVLALQQRVVSRGELQDAFLAIVGQVERMAGILRHLQEFAREDREGEPVPYRIGEVVGRVLGLVDQQLRQSSIRVVRCLAPNLPVCQGWPRELEQVLLNLVLNARDAMLARRKGEANRSWEAVLGIRARRDGAGVRVQVSDTGGGMAPEVAERIFEPFFTTREVGQGTGLGLAIAHGLVRRHGGALEVCNRPGEGATFSVCLPVRPGGNG